MVESLLSCTPPVADVTVIGIARPPLIWRFALLSGHASAVDLEHTSDTIATAVALSLLAMLPPSVRSTYFVSRSWWHPRMRRYLQKSGCSQLIVCGRRRRLDALGAAVILWRTGIKVQAAPGAT